MFASKDTLLTRPSGYTIARSVRIRGSATAYFSKTYGTSPTSRTTMTMSAWVKRGKPSDGTNGQAIFGTGGNYENTSFNTDDTIRFTGPYSSAQQGVYVTTQKFRDYSAWYHIVVVYDTTNATATNRMRLYVNGVQVTSFSTQTTSNQNNTTTEWLNSGAVSYIGQTGSANYFDGYLTEINVIDGQALTPSSFGETDSITGVWKPKAYSGTYGTNGFELNFSDNSNNTAATIGKDYSGNGNNWTPNNINVTAYSGTPPNNVSYDSMVDSPTVGATSSNYCVFSPLYGATPSISDGNLSASTNATTAYGSMSVTSGKWYWEITVSNASYLGVIDSTYIKTDNGWSSQVLAYQSSGNKYNGTSTSYGATYTTNDVIGVALDMDGGTITFYKNNTSQGIAYSSGVSGKELRAFVYSSTSGAQVANFGQRPFSYTPPTGYVALNTYNLPASTIKNGAAYMAATTYTGNATARSISNAVNGISFQPDFIWIKERTTAGYDHRLYDSIRGVTKELYSDLTSAEGTDTQSVTAFNSDGFSLGTSNGVNQGSGKTYIGWNWKAGGTSASNTNGSITSTVSVGATQGFSVVTYTGNGTNNATIGHGLGVTPSMVIVKSRTSSIRSWFVAHTSLATNNNLLLQTTDIAYGPSAFGAGVVGGLTSTVFECIPGTIAPNNVANINTNGENFVAYCFSAVAGYSAFGSYTGNASPDGPFVYTGFRPRFVITKSSDATAGIGDWTIHDTSRLAYNTNDLRIFANASSAESTSEAMDMLSNGFKIRATNSNCNTSGGGYIYMAFAENPFKYALAR